MSLFDTAGASRACHQAKGFASPYRLSHKSLDKFMNRYAEWLSPPYLLSMHDVKVEGNIVFLPLYMSGLLAS